LNIILLSGGSGLRLWPLSNGVQSKQFLKLLENEDSEKESMMQRVYRQLRRTYPRANIVVSSRIDKVAEIKRQLGDVEVIPEPSRRDTYPAIMLAASWLHGRQHRSPDETMIVMPIDVFAEYGYFDALAEVEKLADDYNIGLLGVQPTYPSEKYGYILREGKKVTAFREKPTASVAETLIAQQALWNAGVFGLKIGYALDNVKRYLDPADFENLYEKYGQLPSISFDYEVVEKEKSIGVATYEGVWKDLGTWNTLTEELPQTIIGKNVQISPDSENTHVLNMLNTPVIVLGEKNTVIVACHDGILVSDKAQSSQLKSYAEKLSMRPMYEQQSWGQYRVLDFSQETGNSSTVKRIRIFAGKSIEYSVEKGNHVSLVVVSGQGKLFSGDLEKTLHIGDAAAISSEQKFRLMAVSELEVVEVGSWERGKCVI
jgi:mannose-1-phosphate guanylyltransferase